MAEIPWIDEEEARALGDDEDIREAVSALIAIVRGRVNHTFQSRMTGYSSSSAYSVIARNRGTGGKSFQIQASNGTPTLYAEDSGLTVAMNAFLSNTNVNGTLEASGLTQLNGDAVVEDILTVQDTTGSPVAVLVADANAATPLVKVGNTAGMAALVSPTKLAVNLGRVVIGEGGGGNDVAIEMRQDGSSATAWTMGVTNTTAFRLNNSSGTQAFRIFNSGPRAYISDAISDSESSRPAHSLIVKGDLVASTPTLIADSTNTRVGVGTATPSTTFHARGSFRVDSDAGGGYDNILTIAGSSDRVGINQTNPDEALHVVGSAKVSAAMAVGNDLAIGSTSIPTYRLQITHGSDTDPPISISGSNVYQTTVGAAGGASALPANPTRYLRFRDSQNSVNLVIPLYAES